VFPCTNPAQQAVQQDLPPGRTTAPPDPNTPIFVNSTAHQRRKRVDHSGEDLNTPPYQINNAAGVLSDKTADVRYILISDYSFYG
jgi:alpha-glucosidase